MSPEAQKVVNQLMELAGGYDELMAICDVVSERTGKTATAMQVLEYLQTKGRLP